MNSFNKISAFFLLCTFFFACKKQDLPYKPKPSPFSVSAESNNALAASGGKLTVNITGLTDGWWIVIPEEASGWCSCSRLYGSGDDTVIFTFKANATGESRSVTVQFNPTFNLQPQTLTFRQD